MEKKHFFAGVRKIIASGTVTTLCVFVAILLLGCNNEKEEFILLTISAELNYSIQSGENPIEFVVDRQLIASERGSAVERKLELNAIKGFTHVRGYEYLLKVKAVNGNEAQFSLIETVSKTRKFEEEIVLLNVSIDWLPNGLYGELIKVVSITGDFNPPQWGLGVPILEGFEPKLGFNYLIKASKTVIRMPAQYQGGFIIFSFTELISQTPKTN